MSKIASYPQASALSGTEILPVEQPSGTTKYATVAQVTAAVGIAPPILQISGMTFAPVGDSNTTTLAGVAGRFQLFPWTPPRDMTISAIGVECQTAVASALSKVVVYDTSATTFGPGNLLIETTDLDCSTTGYKSVAWAKTFTKGATYWAGVRTSSTATLRACASIGMPNIGKSAATGTGDANCLQQTLAYATAASSSYGTPALGQLASGQTVYEPIMTLA